MTGGENEGRTLAHEFAVIRLAETDLVPAGAGLEGRLAVALSFRPGSRRGYLAVWVTGRDDLTPLQAAGGWISP